MRLPSCNGLLLPAITIVLACTHAPAAVADAAGTASATEVHAVLARGAADAPFRADARLRPVAPRDGLAVRARLAPEAPSAACDAPDAVFADGFENSSLQALDPSP